MRGVGRRPRGRWPAGGQPRHPRPSDARHPRPSDAAARSDWNTHRQRDGPPVTGRQSTDRQTDRQTAAEAPGDRGCTAIQGEAGHWGGRPALPATIDTGREAITPVHPATKQIAAPAGPTESAPPRPATAPDRPPPSQAQRGTQHRARHREAPVTAHKSTLQVQTTGRHLPSTVYVYSTSDPQASCLRHQVASRLPRLAATEACRIDRVLLQKKNR